MSNRHSDATAAPIDFATFFSGKPALDCAFRANACHFTELGLSFWCLGNRVRAHVRAWIDATLRNRLRHISPKLVELMHCLLNRYSPKGLGM